MAGDEYPNPFLPVAGTLNDEKINKVQLEGLFGKVNSETSTKQLMDKWL